MSALSLERQMAYNEIISKNLYHDILTEKNRILKTVLEDKRCRIQRDIAKAKDYLVWVNQ